MKKIIIKMFIFLLLFISCLCLWTNKVSNEGYIKEQILLKEIEIERTKKEIIDVVVLKIKNFEEIINIKFNTFRQLITKQLMKIEIKELSYIEDKQKWFIEYKNILNKYSYKIETIYNEFSQEEIEIFQRIVEAEVTGGDFLSKVNVANVILNRVENEQFPNTINEVVFQEYQFSPVIDGRFYSVEVSESTILAIEYAYMFEDTTNGALYFESGNNFVHMAYAEYLFTDNVGHHFYK